MVFVIIIKKYIVFFTIIIFYYIFLVDIAIKNFFTLREM